MCDNVDASCSGKPFSVVSVFAPDCLLIAGMGGAEGTAGSLAGGAGDAGAGSGAGDALRLRVGGD